MEATPEPQASRLPHYGHMVRTLDGTKYDQRITDMRAVEFPMLQDQLYLDHAGMTLYSKSLLDRFHHEMSTTLLGNPHSASTSSQTSTLEIDKIRHRLLAVYSANPTEFDLVFTVNATAAIKVVLEAFREQDAGFEYAFHVDSHTSLVGVRESAQRHQCLTTDAEVQDWLSGCGESVTGPRIPKLFAYPAQSNMNGRRLSRTWCQLAQHHDQTYTLLDAASFAATSRLDLSDPQLAADFTVVSVHKTFGFPDLGALIVRRKCAPLFDRRSYFGGGTVDMVVCLKEQWHALKSESLHARLEDGTVPVHSILALKAALSTHAELFGTLDQVAQHTADLAERLHSGLMALRHANGIAVCTTYKDAASSYNNPSTQGPIVAFNISDSQGEWTSTTEVEKLAAVNGIHLRTGGLCNPGGIANALRLSPWEMEENFSAGFRCGAENDIVNGKPTGVIRLSLGAMSTRQDVTRAVAFFDEFFVARSIPASLTPRTPETISLASSGFHIESLTVYPIKSCRGWVVPFGKRWEVRPEGLVWDREWCLVHLGTGKALSQKQHPRMALIRADLDFTSGMLRVSLPGVSTNITVPLSKDPTWFTNDSFHPLGNTNVCGDTVSARVYHDQTIADFFTTFLGVSCTLARYPAAPGIGSRHSKPQLAHGQCNGPRPLLLSNESPILTISRSSLNRLNEQIKARGAKAAHPAVFRANIVLAESPLLRPGQERPWAEDAWTEMRVWPTSSSDGRRRPVDVDFLGPCRRCQMVCVDQVSAEKNPEPFVTLAKTRRRAGRVYFGVHSALADRADDNSPATIQVGDEVETLTKARSTQDMRHVTR